MRTNDSRHVHVCQLISSIGGSHWNEVHYLGESVDNDPDRVMTLARRRYSSDEVHAYLFPLPFKNSKRLQQSCRHLVLGFHSLADVTLGNVQGNLTLHTVPPEQVPQVLIHLSPSRVDGVRCIVSFLQDSELQLLYIRHTQSAIEPKNSVIIYCELRGFAEGHLPLDSLDTIVSLLCLLDLIK